MKKSKFLIFAALAAATVAISSCSDNDVLDSTTKAKGNALIVNASLNDGSRIATTGSDGFNSFMLYGYTNPTSGTPTSLFDVTGDGIAYQKTSGTWGLVDANLASKAVWPSSSGGTYNFYALSVDGSASLPSYTGVSLTNINQGQFVYTGKSDLSEQEDILVASSLGTVKPAGGILTLPFKHALAKLTMQLRFNSYELNDQNLPATTGNLLDTYEFYINSITIHNVKVNGVYSFKTGWDASGLSDIIYTFPADFKLTPKHITSSEESLFQDLVTEANSIMIVPQTFDSHWDPTKTPTAAGSAPYVDIDGWILNLVDTYKGLKLDYDNDGTSMTQEQAELFVTSHSPSYLLAHENDVVYTDNTEDHNEFTGSDIMSLYAFQVGGHDQSDKLYFTFPTTLTSFAQNKYYNLRLNIYNAYYDNGTKALTASGMSN